MFQAYAGMLIARVCLWKFVFSWLSLRFIIFSCYWLSLFPFFLNCWFNSTHFLIGLFVFPYWSVGVLNVLHTENKSFIRRFTNKCLFPVCFLSFNCIVSFIMVSSIIQSFVSYIYACVYTHTHIISFKKFYSFVLHVWSP